MTDPNLALQVAALKVLSEYTAEKYAWARGLASNAMARGERIVARSPVDNRKIAVIPKSDPKPVVFIVDGKALTEWMAEHYPATIEARTEIAGSEAEVVRVLFQHAPHLLKRGQRITPEALSELKRTAVALGQPIGPGGEANIPGLEVRESNAVVSCRPEDGALEIIKDLHDQGILELDGTIMAPREVTA